jgi:hypothetical protein
LPKRGGADPVSRLFAALERMRLDRSQERKNARID